MIEIQTSDNKSKYTKVNNKRDKEFLNDFTLIKRPHIMDYGLSVF